MQPLTVDDGLTLAAEFPPAEFGQWHALVAKVLKGADFERKLVRATHDRIQVGLLYTAPELGDLAGLPGAAPFTRGSSVAGTVASGWDVRQRHGGMDPTVLNAHVLEDLERGVTSIQLQLDAAASTDLERVLSGVHLDLAPIGLAAGKDFVASADALLQLCRRRGHDPATVRAELNADPLGAAVAGEEVEPEAGLTAAVALANEVASTWPGIVALVADGRPYHAGGGSEAQELACTVATGICYLRAIVEAGLPPAAAAAQIGMALAADADSFSRLPSSGHCAGCGAGYWRWPGPPMPCRVCICTRRRPRGC